MLKRALEHVIEDGSFNIGVEPAATALKTAKNVLHWGSQEENESTLSAFELRLISELRTCIHSNCKDVRSFQVQRVELWRSYHSLRTSKHFNETWHGFLRQGFLQLLELIGVQVFQVL